MSDFRSFCDDVLVRARNAGWEVVGEKSLPYGRQFTLLQHGATKAMLSCYHGKKGFSFVPGGKHADELAEILGGARPAKASAPGNQADPFGLGFAFSSSIRR